MFTPATKKDVEKILMKISEVAGVVSTISTGIDTISTEVAKVGTEVQSLKDSLGNVDLPADAQAALDSLSGRVTTLADAVKKVDDIIPDNPTPTP